jgi:hypothetical protein
MASLVGHGQPVYLMPDAAVRIHHAEETFEGGLLENERSCKTSNHCSYYHYGVHFHVLRPKAEQSACQSPQRSASRLAGMPGRYGAGGDPVREF